MSEIPGVPDAVVQSVRSIPLPRQAADDNADREWIATYLASIYGRPVIGGFRFDELLAKFTELRRAR